VADPATRERDAELVRLRAEVAELRGTDLPIVVIRDEMADLNALAAWRAVGRR